MQNFPASGFEILDSLTASIAVVDDQGFIIAVNKAWRDYAAENTPPDSLQYFIGVNYLEVCKSVTNGPYVDAAIKFYAGLKSVLAGHLSEYQMEYTCHTPHENQWFHVRVTPLRGSIQGAVVSHQNVTAYKQADLAREQLEIQLRQSQKMEAIGTLAGGIAHDFNNILTIILANTELASIYVNEDPQECLRRIEETEIAAQRARSLVRQILTFSRKQNPLRTQVSLTEIVEESVKLLRSTLPSRIKLQFLKPEDTVLILADPTQIEQVVVNLVTNSMQAMSTGIGEISIQIDMFSSDALDIGKLPALDCMLKNHPAKLVRLTIKDNGPGIDSVTLARIFEPFFTTKNPGEGTGLGLSVVHRIVESHEGAIIVESQLGQGALFSIYFPAAKGSTAVKDTANSWTGKELHDVSRITEDHPHHILYLDDDHAVVRSRESMLKRLGHMVSSFTDQEDALTAIRENPKSFSLVISDYNMPGKSGLDVASEIRNIRADLPIAITSGHIDQKLAAEAEESGICALIPKPTTLQELLVALLAITQKTTDGKNQPTRASDP